MSMLATFAPAVTTRARRPFASVTEVGSAAAAAALMLAVDEASTGVTMPNVWSECASIW
jgi:hypothetical protein